MLRQIISKARRDGLAGVAIGFKARASSKIRRELAPLAPSLIPYLYKKPATLFVETTNNCNLSCEMCYRGKRKCGYMSPDLFKKVVDDAAKIGNICLSLHFGGETLVCPNFLEYLEYAMSKRKHFYNVGFFTNGMLFDKKIAEAVVRLDVDWVTWSLDGIGEVTERIRRGSNYKLFEENLNRLLEIRGKNLKPVVGINMTVSTQTLEQFQEVFKVWGGKVDHINSNPTIDEHFRVINQGQYGSKLDANAMRPPCYMPTHMLSILWNGDAVFCCHDVNGQGVVGNAYTSTLTEIWQGPKLEQVRKHLATKHFDSSELCGKCRKFSVRTEEEVARTRNEEGLEIQVDMIEETPY